MKGYQLRNGIEGMAHKVCAALGLPPVTIRWTGISTAAINQRGDMMLANVRDDEQVTPTLVNKYAGFVVHELLHRKYTDFTARDGRGYVDALHNAVEDAWIERRAISSGLTGNIEVLLSTLVDAMADKAMAAVSDWDDQRQYPFALALWARGFCKRVPVPANLHPIFNEAQQRIDTCLNSQDTLTVARWVFDQIKQQGEQQGDDQQGEQGGEGGENGSEAGEEGAQGDQSGGEGQDKGEGENGSEGAPSSGAGDQPRAGNQSRPVSPYGDAAVVEPTLDRIGDKQWDFSREDVISAKFHLRGEGRKLAQFTGGKLRFEVRRLFENSAYDDWSLNRRSGVLNTGALAKVSMTERVFKRHQEHDGIESAVIIAVDASGSMSQFDRMETAQDAAGALYETLTAAGCSVSVVSFEDDVSVPVPFGTQRAKAVGIIGQITESGGTNDAKAVRQCHDMLLQRPEQRKVLFVLTDGDGYPKQARDQVNIGERLGITTVGIGIHADVRHVYPQSISVNNMNDLMVASFKQIKLAA